MYSCSIIFLEVLLEENWSHVFNFTSYLIDIVRFSQFFNCSIYLLLSLSLSLSLPSFLLPTLTSYISFILCLFLLTVNKGRDFTVETNLPIADATMTALAMYDTLIGVAFSDAGEETKFYHFQWIPLCLLLICLLLMLCDAIWSYFASFISSIC